jgi:LytS/YehU family sensor histidine kinase
VLQVADDGVGLPPTAEIVESTGVGNTRRRLATLYGDLQSLALVPRAAGGTEVVVTLPFRPLAPARPAEGMGPPPHAAARASLAPGGR